MNVVHSSSCLRQNKNGSVVTHLSHHEDIYDSILNIINRIIKSICEWTASHQADPKNGCYVAKLRYTEK